MGGIGEKFDTVRPWEGKMHEDDQLTLFELSARFPLVDLDEEEDAPDGWVPIRIVVHEQGGPQ